MTDTLPTGLTLDAVIQQFCSAVGQAIACTIGDLASGASSP